MHSPSLRILATSTRMCGGVCSNAPTRSAGHSTCTRAWTSRTEKPQTHSLVYTLKRLCLSPHAHIRARTPCRTEAEADAIVRLGVDGMIDCLSGTRAVAEFSGSTLPEVSRKPARHGSVLRALSNRALSHDGHEKRCIGSLNRIVVRQPFTTRAHLCS